MKTPPFTSRLVAAAAGAALMLGAAPSFAAGFLINESSVSGLGNAFAGGAAAAEDATTMWSNVAGMSRIRSTEAVGGLHLITPSMKFRDEGSKAALGQVLGGDGGDAGGLAAVPNFYIVSPVSNSVSLGLGITAPWGLVTDYDAGWIGRFQAIKSSIKTMNVNPAVSWKPSSNVSLGLGANLQRMEAEFTNQVNYSGALWSAAARNGIAPGSANFNTIAAATSGLETAASIKGSDNAWGWNAGVLWDLDSRNRFGMHYRSSIKYTITGDARFQNPTVPTVAGPLGPTVAALAAGVNSVLSDTKVTSDVKLPEIVNLSFFSNVDDRWDLMADLQWTGWSTIKTLSFVRADGTVLQSTPENFQNAWKVAIGANYRYSPGWTLRGGLAFDQSPVQSAFRTARLPDADRTWLTAGAQYAMSRNLKFDFGAAYIWVKKATINNNGEGNTNAYGLLNGHYNSNTVILSAQLNYAF